MSQRPRCRESDPGNDPASGENREIRAIEDRYARRQGPADSRRYDPLDPYVTRSRQERERALIHCIQRAGLAPPIGRRLCRIAPALYPVLNALPPLRTHLLCWIQKPGAMS